MPYRPRTGTAGVVFHVLNRAVRRDRLFDSISDYRAFLKVIAQAQARIPLRILAYCVMPNHFHLVVWPSTDGELSSFIRTELLAIPEKKIKAFLTDSSLADWRLTLERIVRYRPHTLGKKEEQLLAMQGQMSDAANQIFRQLNDADLKWGAVKNEKGQKVELSHSSFSAFLHSPSRAVRKEAFHTY